MGSNGQKQEERQKGADGLRMRGRGTVDSGGVGGGGGGIGSSGTKLLEVKN